MIVTSVKFSLSELASAVKPVPEVTSKVSMLMHKDMFAGKDKAAKKIG